jgi:hypothetical protein
MPGDTVLYFGIGSAKPAKPTKPPHGTDMNTLDRIAFAIIATFLAGIFAVAFYAISLDFGIVIAAASIISVLALSWAFGHLTEPRSPARPPMPTPEAHWKPIKTSDPKGQSQC